MLYSHNEEVSIRQARNLLPFFASLSLPLPLSLLCYINCSRDQGGVNAFSKCKHNEYLSLTRIRENIAREWRTNHASARFFFHPHTERLAKKCISNWHENKKEITIARIYQNVRGRKKSE